MQARNVRFVGWGAALALILSATLTSGCCTEEIGQAVGEAARDSMYAEQDRIQQRFLQAEADSLAATRRMMEDMTNKLTETAEQNMTSLASTTSAAFAETMAASADNFNNALEQSGQRFQQSMQESAEASMLAMSQASQRMVEVGNESSERMAETFSDTMERVQDRTNQGFEELAATIDEQRDQLTENLAADFEQLTREVSEDIQAQIDETADHFLEVYDRTSQDVIENNRADEMRETVQPAIDKIIQDSAGQMGQEMQRQVDQLSFPMVIALGAIAALILLLMIVPSTLLFLSYRRSTRAIDALKGVIAAHAGLQGLDAEAVPEALVVEDDLPEPTVDEER